jgi:hypothetical protein
MKTPHRKLLSEIEDFLSRVKMGESYFGKAACGNSELITRLRNGGRVWPETEQRVRDFMSSRLSGCASHTEAC